MISADATESQAKRLMAMGANDYLTKPIDVTQFLTTVDHYLKNRSKGKGRVDSSKSIMPCL